MTSCGCHMRAIDCGVDARRQRLLGNPAWNGIDYVDVLDDQRSICVHMFGRIPELTASQIHICGGVRIREIAVTGIALRRAEEPDGDDCLHITVDRAGDFSTYCLCIGERVRGGVDACGEAVAPAGADWQPLPGFDPRYSCAEFTFKAGCPTPFDCRTEETCVAPVTSAPAIDYLARDYGSFKRLILDRLAVTLPDWRERHVPDLGVALVELLAYVADGLAYYQDAVANEAYLRTARRRISVRRHARLIDYRMHEGCNARAFLTLDVPADGPLDLSRVAFCTPPADRFAGRTLAQGDLDGLPSDAVILFEPLLPARTATMNVVAAQSEMHFHTWGNRECCLPRGATRATLVDRDPPGAPAAPGPPVDGRANGLGLRVGDVLIVEEVLGPTTGHAADADPSHRQAVRLTAVRADRDGLLDVPIVDVEWSVEDALTFVLCLSSRTTACRDLADVSVARGNVILVDHGRSRTDCRDEWTVTATVTQVACGCGENSPPEVRRTPARLDLTLPRSPVAFAEPIAAAASASALTRQDPRRARPSLVLTSTRGRVTPPGPATTWTPRLDLLASDRDDPHIVLEVDDDRVGHVRFGDGVHGRRPEWGATFEASYRIGNGLVGNVGADSIVCLVGEGAPLSGVHARNPLPAVGGVDPEPVEEVKLFAPGAVRRHLARAIVAEDYAALARLDTAVQNAAATLAWTGSWYEAHVAVDAFGADQAPPSLRSRVETRLDGYRRVGHDLAVAAARAVPLVVEVTVCVRDGHLAAHVRSAVRDRLGARRLSDGSSGFFHPDNLTFGEGIHLSRLVAAVQAIDGVKHIEVTRLERFPHDPAAPDSSAIEAGVLKLGRGEIAQVTDDPNFPEHGTLTLVMRGGR